jgi:hypothetical protein
MLGLLCLMLLFESCMLLFRESIGHYIICPSNYGLWLVLLYYLICKCRKSTSELENIVKMTFDNFFSTSGAILRHETTTCNFRRAALSIITLT